MKFCDVYCCYEMCDNIGVYPFNFSKYHKVCKAHQDYIATRDFFSCSYCNTMCPVITAITSGKPLCAICSIENTANDYTNLCFKCFNYRRCTTCYHVTDKINFRSCNHAYCEVCIKECFICNNICSVCFEQVNNKTEINCRHSKCSNCANKECDACNKGILCSRCKKNGQFQVWESNQTVEDGNNLVSKVDLWVCKDCRSIELKKLMNICQNCGVLEIVYKRECSHDWCQNCWHNACNLCQPCNYCQNYSHCVSKPCSHKFCANCVSYPCPYCCQSHNTLLTIPDCSHPFCSLCINANYCTICHPDNSKQQVYSEQLSEAKTEITSAAKSEWDGYEVIPNEENKIESTEELSDDEDKDYTLLGANKVIKGDPYTLDIKQRISNTHSANFTELIKLSESIRVKECKSVVFDNKKTICENCGELGKKKMFECNHYGCEDCIFNQLCKICLNRTKICIMCPGIAQTKALLRCGHEACFKCLDKQCRFCENFKSKCNKCNKKRFLKKKLDSLNQPCGHLYCFECILKMESCPLCQLAQKSKPFCNHTDTGPCKICNKKCEICKDFLKNCENCNSNSYYCDNPACYNHTCKICKINFNPCSNCKKKIKTTKCPVCLKLICMECSNSHTCQKLNCLNCKLSIIANTSLCCHTFCQSCFEGLNKTCSFCHPSSVKCSTCQLPGFKKMIFDCKHLGCSNCFKNLGCFDCIFKKRLLRPVEYQMYQCCNCKRKTKEGFNLLCDHFVCNNCRELDWGCLNYNCFECILVKESNKVCLECKKNFNIKLKNDFFIKICCDYRICKEHVCKINKDGCLYCYEQNIRNNS